MFEYKTEILKTKIKLLKDSACEGDASNLDELIMKRESEGWEFVQYSYMVNVLGATSSILVTFRKKK